MQSVWNVKKYDEKIIAKIAKENNVSEMIAKLLVARGIQEKEINNFLYGTIQDIHDPFLIKDMKKLVDRVKIAITNKERICIYGDYDVDGITSITILYQFLTSIGADVIYYLPDRLIEGYGVNNTALDGIKQRGASLVITVDCGITAINETEYAKSIGLDMCITDHHECSENLPNAIAIVNPKQKDDTSFFKMHAGVGVAFKCIMAIAKEYELADSSYLQYIDIVAIGTISDIVPLVDENRVISKIGLDEMKHTNNIGLKALLKILNFNEVDSTMVSFGIAPRINACGRMGKAGVAVELLLEKDENKAEQIARKLDMLNAKRQQVEKAIFEEALNEIVSKKLDESASIVLYNPNWHNGVIGIVASRLVGIYYKPVILLTKEQNVIRGSGRCQVGASLYDILTRCKDLLLQFGGHELAAGLSIAEENIEKFREEFEKVVKETTPDTTEQMIEIDTQITVKDLNLQLLKDIYQLKPYGQSNRLPLFLYKDLKIDSIRTLKEDKHLKLTLRDGKFLLEGLAFSQGNRRDELRIGDKVDVVCNVELNSYHSPKTIQLVIQDFKKSIE
ncbi:MAG: single-stranded-DNA-specific exonuclease RecJ [Clostridia bacterium]|nr:single-stranded-DNA-specific exonuclease RecJ [Clostridia bacterium]